MNAVTLNQNLQVRAAALTGLSVSPTSVTGGNGSTGTVTVSGNIPAGGITIQLSDNSAFASVPASVNVPQGQTSATFPISTSAVTSTQVAQITATFEGVNRNANLTINPEAAVSLTAFSIAQSSVNESHNATGTVTLSGPAPTGGVVVSLTEVGTNVLNLPASVTVPAGSSTANVTIGTNDVSAQTAVTVSASYGGDSFSDSFTINLINITSFTVSPTSVPMGTPSTGTVQISAPAGPGGIVVSLSSNQSAAQVPATVTVPSGATSVSFTITTTAVRSKTTAQIRATRHGVTLQAKLVITKSSGSFKPPR
jgi:hypothetical protein